MRPAIVHWLAGFVRADVADAIAPSWFTCIGVAGLVGLVLMLALARRRGLDRGAIASVVFWGYLAAVVAGIAVPMLLDAIERAVATGHVVGLRWAGMTSFWGYLAGAVAVALVCRRDGIALAQVADLAAIPIGAALVFARLGCFVAGCDYGAVSSVPWAVRFPAGSPAWRDQLHAGLIPAGRAASLPVHPTQLYEAALGLVIIAVAWAVGRRTRRAGHVFFAAAATYALGRLGIEMLRGDVGRGIHAGLSSGQIFCLLVLAAIAVRLAWRRRAIAVATATTLALAGTAEAQPGALPGDPQPTDADLPPPPVVDDDTPATSPPPFVPPVDTTPTPPPPPGAVPRLRPIFAVGLLVGGASVVSSHAGQTVPDLAGTSLSLGYVPGRFGVWLDLDRYTNDLASHASAVASVSFAPRVTHHLWIGARAGVGTTRVSFMSPAFADIVAPDFRIDTVAELVMSHHWVVWVRPLTIDVVSSPELGGSLTTLQFRAGVAFRFGERHR